MSWPLVEADQGEMSTTSAVPLALIPVEGEKTCWWRALEGKKVLPKPPLVRNERLEDEGIVRSQG
jgi:hypothetical protein